MKIHTAEFWDALRQVDDPEMPLSIVDLGMVADVRVEPLAAVGGATPATRNAAVRPAPATAHAEPVRVLVDVTPTFVGCPALLVIEESIIRRLRALPGVGAVRVNFVYEPAWSVDRISDAGRASLKSKGITVPERGGAATCAPPTSFVPLTVGERDAETGGGARPVAGDRASCDADRGAPGDAAPAVIACPWCASADTTLESPFGPTRCKMIYYCRACKNSFEHMKRV
ncbi:MAG: iron-sulfur cluster assembly protein [Phycisphaerae bacterium]